MYYINEKMTFSAILIRSFRLHALTLKHIMLPILFITIVKNVATLLAQFFLSPYEQIAIGAVMWLLILYLFSAGLLAMHQVFTDHAQSIAKTSKSILSRWLPILFTSVAYIAGTYLVYKFMGLMIYMVDRLIHVHSALHGATLIVTAALVIMYVAMFSFSIPLCVLDKKNTPRAFRDSLILTEKNRFGVLVVFLLIGAIILLVSPASIHEYLLSTYHLDVVFDFIVFCVGLPFLTNILLLLIHDSKQKAVGLV